jgi:hypothetical protein
MKHLLVINRYDDEFSDYSNYIDHTKIDVSYITLTEKSKLIDPEISAYVIAVTDLSRELVLSAASNIHNKLPIDFVIAFSEYDLDVAALIRTKLNINGSKVTDNQLVRNKANMKAALSGSSIRYPYYSEVSSREDILNFCQKYDYPIILKPQVGAASDGVVKIEKIDDIPDLINFENYEVEEYIEGNIYHIDAILSDSKMPYFKVSKYINTCLDFRHGKPLGSVTIDDPKFISMSKNFTKKVCELLKISNQAIHLEAIEYKDELIFLEIGGRVGGGEIPFITMRHEKVDLFELWTKATIGEHIPVVSNQITGFLMMPNPFANDFSFNPSIDISHPLITWKNISYSGHSEGFSYENIPARLHFCGPTQLEVENAIKECMSILSEAIQEVSQPKLELEKTY